MDRLESEEFEMMMVTISLPEPLDDWVQQRVASGDYATADDFIRDLVRHDLMRRKTLDAQLQTLRASPGEADALDFIDAVFTPE